MATRRKKQKKLLSNNYIWQLEEKNKKNKTL